jgi:hypothetical protein
LEIEGGLEFVWSPIAGRYAATYTGGTIYLEISAGAWRIFNPVTNNAWPGTGQVLHATPTGLFGGGGYTVTLALA